MTKIKDFFRFKGTTKTNKIWLAIDIALIIAALISILIYFIFFYGEKEEPMEKGNLEQTEQPGELLHPEVDEPEVFHDTYFNVDYLFGLWEENDVFYRYNEDGSAVTWDVSDDVSEEEGTELDWEIKRDQFIHYYKMEMGKGVIPKQYTMKILEIDSLVYEDDFGVRHAFSKVEELQLLN